MEKWIGPNDGTNWEKSVIETFDQKRPLVAIVLKHLTKKKHAFLVFTPQETEKLAEFTRTIFMKNDNQALTTHGMVTAMLELSLGKRMSPCPAIVTYVKLKPAPDNNYSLAIEINRPGQVSFAIM